MKFLRSGDIENCAATSPIPFQHIGSAISSACCHCRSQPSPRQFYILFSKCDPIALGRQHVSVVGNMSVALSKEQYLWMQEAIANWRQVQATLKRMEQISHLILFRTIPEPPRRKTLSKKVLGLN